MDFHFWGVHLQAERLREERILHNTGSLSETRARPHRQVHHNNWIDGWEMYQKWMLNWMAVRFPAVDALFDVHSKKERCVRVCGSLKLSKHMQREPGWRLFSSNLLSSFYLRRWTRIKFKKKKRLCYCPASDVHMLTCHRKLVFKC